MATAIAKVGVELSMGQAKITLFEGDVVSGLVYEVSGKQKEIDGQIRVINATTRANSSIPDECPPEPYVHKYITPMSLMIDSSDVFEAELVKVDINSIRDVKTVNGENITAVVDGFPFGRLSDAVKYAAIKYGTDPVTIYLTGDTATDDEVVIPAGSKIKILGINSPNPVIYSRIRAEVVDDALVNTVLYLESLVMDGSAIDVVGSAIGIFSGDGTLVHPSTLDLSLKDVVVQNFIGKGMYLTNVQKLVIQKSVLQNNATGPMGSPNIYGDYSLDVNLIGVQDSEITLHNVTFKGKCGNKAVMKVAQRGGMSDTGATDIPTGSIATVKLLKLTGVTFADADTEIDLNIGTTSKTAGQEHSNTTGAYEVLIEKTGSSTMVKLPYIPTGDNEFDVPMGHSAHKEANGEFVID